MCCTLRPFVRKQWNVSLETPAAQQIASNYAGSPLDLYAAHRHQDLLLAKHVHSVAASSNVHGLVVKLSANPTEYADKYAASGTYILVEKQLGSESGRASPKKNQDPYIYTSLLDNYQELFPNLVSFHTTSEKPVRKDRNKLQTPSNTRKLKPASPRRSASKSVSPSRKSANRANTR